jgi:flagellar motor switch protein FliN/FliY
VPLSDESGLVTATVVITLPGTAAAEPAFAPVGEPEKLAPEVATLDTEAAPQVHLPQQVAVPRGGAPDAARHGGGLDLLRDVAMEVTVELGRTRMTVRELLSLTPGAVVELDRAAGSPADLLVNGTLIARGEIVVVDEDFGIRITEIVAPGADGAGDLPSSGRGAA